MQRGKVSLLNVILTPILIIAIALGFMIYNLVSLIPTLANGGNIAYDQTVLDEYQTKEYNSAFKNAPAEGNGLVITFMYNEDTNAMEYVIKAGNNLRTQVTDIFKVEGEFGQYLNKHATSDNYKATFSKSLVNAMDHMAKEVTELDLTDVFNKNYKDGQMPEPKLVDKSGFSLDVKAVNAELKEFYDETGISVTVVVDNAAKVFGRSIPVTDILLMVLILLVIVMTTVSLVKKIRAYKRGEFNAPAQGQGAPIRVNPRSPYYDEEEDGENTEAEAEDAEADDAEAEEDAEAEDDSDKTEE